MNRASIPPPLTAVLLLISTATAILTLLNGQSQFAEYYFLSVYERVAGVGLPEVLSGQVWRLISPIFLHFGFVHFAFDMIWLYGLGRLIEARIGTLRFGVLAIGGAIASNLAQYYAVGPIFGGMSGVDYALFGYALMRERLNPTGYYGLAVSNAVVMLGWFVLCWLGIIGSVANWAHAGGLIFGGLLALLDFAGEGRYRRFA